MKLKINTYIKRDFNKWSMLTLAIIGLIIIPLVTILLELFSGPGETWLHVAKNLLPSYSLNSLWLILGCSTLTLLFGVYSAWIVSRYEFPFKRLVEWLLILPLTIPSYIVAYAYAGFFDYGGSLELMMRSIGIDAVKFDIMNIYGLILVLSVSLFPYVYVSSRAVFLFQSARLIEASKLLGANEFKTFFKVVLPIARPAIVGGVLLVIMEVLNDYGAAKYYGVTTFTTGIFRAWFSLEDPATAIYLSALLLLIVFLCIAIERWQRGNKRYTFASKSNIELVRKKIFGLHKISVIISVLIPVILGFLLPVLQLIYWSMLTFKTVITSEFFFIALESFGIAFLSALLIVIIAVMILYVSKWNRILLLKQSSKLAIIGYAIPGAIIAIGVMIPLLKLDKWLIVFMKQSFDIEIGLILNGTIIVLIYAYIIRFLAVAFNPIEASYLKIPKSLSESSKLLGKNNLKTFFNIDLPLLKTSLLSAFILVFIDIMKELPLTLILKPYNVNTLAVKAYEYASDELIMEASIPSLCIIATGVIPVILLNRMILKKNINVG